MEMRPATCFEVRDLIKSMFEDAAGCRGTGRTDVGCVEWIADSVAAVDNKRTVS